MSETKKSDKSCQDELSIVQVVENLEYQSNRSDSLGSTVARQSRTLDHRGDPDENPLDALLEDPTPKAPEDLLQHFPIKLQRLKAWYKLQLEKPWSASETSASVDKVAFKQDTLPHLALQETVSPGTQLGTETSFGTFGCYLQSRDGGRVLGLTCGHTFQYDFGDADIPAAEFYFPDPLLIEHGEYVAQIHLWALFKDMNAVYEALVKLKGTNDKCGFERLGKKLLQRLADKRSFWDDQRLKFISRNSDMQGLSKEEAHSRSRAGKLIAGLHKKRHEPKHRPSEDWAILEVNKEKIPAVPNAIIFEGKHLGTLKGWKDPTLGMTVAKLGVSTGLNYARIGPEMSKRDGYYEAFMIRNGTTECTLSKIGDSGAIVYDPTDFTVVGMLYGSWGTNSDAAVLTMRTILSDIEKAYGVAFDIL